MLSRKRIGFVARWARMKDRLPLLVRLALFVHNLVIALCEWAWRLMRLESLIRDELL